MHVLTTLKFSYRYSNSHSTDSHLEGKCEERGTKGRPQRIWLEDIKTWTGIENYGEIKRMAEDRDKWRQIVTANLQLEDDTP